MCGICGIWRREQPVHKAELTAMCERMVHRGPDDEGYYVNDYLGLGMRRLAIIDVVGGQQPISNEDGSIHIVFNGEIYNYIELKKTLIERGHRFRTESDTETIIHAYEEFGLDCLQYLNGMFAFAIWDCRTNRLLICRDRLGEKPLYYQWDGSQLLFASELKALMPHLEHSPQPDLQAIHHYLSFQHIPSPHTIFEGVKKLPPAHYLMLHQGELTVHRYWDIHFQPQWTDDRATLQERLREEVIRSVQWRLRSDVPLGAFLSGGIDSAVIVAVMARLLERPVHAFTIAFEPSSFDESAAAAVLAHHVGADHTIEPVHLDVLNDLPRIIPFLDEPFADSSALPSFFLCQAARRHVTVALSGDGGDEVFGGYQRYSLDKLARFYGWLPRGIRRQLIDRAARMLPTNHHAPIEKNYLLGLRRLQQVMEVPESASILRWGSYFSNQMKHSLYRPGFIDALPSSVDILSETFYQSDARSLLGRTIHTDLLHYLPDNGLVKTDRMSMAHSLELRLPLLDHQLVEFAARLPDHHKVRGLQRKLSLRQAFADWLPQTWTKQPKRGFEVPLGLWFRDMLYPMARDTLLSSNAIVHTWCRPAAIESLFDEHHAGKDDHSRRLWALLILELWLQHANSLN